jgi:hypothetical protein
MRNPDGDSAPKKLSPSVESGEATTTFIDVADISESPLNSPDGTLLSTCNVRMAWDLYRREINKKKIQTRN